MTLRDPQPMPDVGRTGVTDLKEETMIVDELPTSEWLRTRSAGGVEYNGRLADVWDALFRHDFSTVRELREEVGGTPREITAKLQALQRLGLVSYDKPEWYVETE